MYLKRRPGPTGRYGGRGFLPLPGHVKCQKSWIGTFGLELQNPWPTTPLICPLTGEAGGLLGPVPWAIWLVISWIRFTGFCRSIIPTLQNAASVTYGRTCGPKEIML